MFAPFARSAWRRWFLDRHTEFWLGELGSTWSPSELRARVVEVVDETPDTKTFVLAPNRHWPGHRAGQFVPIDVEIDGVRMRRCYSISSGASGPGDRIAITVKRVPGGRVSTWLHEHLQAGDRVGLGTPGGDFVVEAADDDGPLLLVAAGSGITPIMAMLRDLEARAILDDVVLVYATRGPAIFGRELAMMARQQPGLRLVVHHSEHGRLDEPRLHALVPDVAKREVFVCGPPGFLDGLDAHRERFVPPPRPAGAPSVVQLAGRRVAIDGRGSLLEQLERAGERPASGCRMGICNTCRCTKRSGTVENLLTGEVSSEPDAEIKLCVSIARSPLELL